ncbi:MAG: SDR family oxidoreductase [Armatimonadetes bacterium]|nr:SDR family oxidoreductase [Armatimonadota bacterium]
MQLKGRTAIVTGAGSGIGRALALEFARQGANVVCSGRRRDKLRETVALLEEETGRECGLAVPADVTQRDQVGKMVAAAIERFGQIDALYNNAGQFLAHGGLWQVDPEDWWADVTTNLYGPMLYCHSVLPHMMERNEGIIINMNGGGFDRPHPGVSSYACSKAALMRLTDNLAAELERVGSSVLVFGLAPGFVHTDMIDQQLNSPTARWWNPFHQEWIDAGRNRPAEDCARAAVKLIEIAPPELNGRVFHVDDDLDDIARRAVEIRSKDIYALRFNK